MTAYQSAPPRPQVVLAALAFDDTGERALMEAARIAERNPGTELHAVHVVAEQDVNKELVSIDVRLSGAPDEIRKRVELLWSRHALNVTAHVRVGPAAKLILQAATDLSADLIVVGTHRRTGLGKLLIGSVAEQVLREAHCSVLIALPKDYAGAARGQEIEPPCPDCVSVRRASGNGEHTYWCERHTRGYVQPHIYEPNEGRRSSIMPNAT